MLRVTEGGIPVGVDFYLYLLNTFFILFIAIWEVRRPAKALNWIIIVLFYLSLVSGYILAYQTLSLFIEKD